jgi:pimeloyl-ACP methyl ester carboxylesterase
VLAGVRLAEAHLPGGTVLACRSAGTGPVRALLLHGFPEAAFAWDGVLQRLAPRHAAVAPNQRGYPGSSAPAGDAAYRARHLVADLAALIEQLGAPLPLLVAHDWGGAVAWNLAAQRPDLIRRLLIINSPHPATLLRELRHDPEQIAASAYMNFLVRPDAAALLAEGDFRRLWPFFGDAAWLDAAQRERYREAWRNGGRGLDPMLAWYRASPLRPALPGDARLAQNDLPDEAVTVRVPTTVLWGERDAALRPGLLRGLERWVPQLELTRVPEGSHWLVHEQPGLVADTAQALIQQALGQTGP